MVVWGHKYSSMRSYILQASYAAGYGVPPFLKPICSGAVCEWSVERAVECMLTYADVC